MLLYHFCIILYIIINILQTLYKANDIEEQKPHLEKAYFIEHSQLEFSLASSPKKIGEGTFAQVYQSRYREESCAVKVFKENSFEVDGLLADTKVTSNLSLAHENLVKIHGLWQETKKSPRYGIVMELCDRNLFTHLNTIAKEGKVTFFQLEKKLGILHDICEAMIFLHSQEITHGHLYARNVLLVGVPSNMRAKVTDFGVHRYMKPSKNESKYKRADVMPLEFSLPSEGHCTVKSLKAVDVFSFGCLVIHVNTCKYPAPLPISSTAEREYSRRKHAINQIQKHRQTFESLIKKCLADTPEARGDFSDKELLLKEAGKGIRKVSAAKVRM